MKKFLNSHPNIAIGTLAVVIVIVLAGFYSWAIGDVFTQMDRALVPAAAQSAIDFNLSGASKLDLRGLMSGGANANSAPVPAPAATITTTTAAISTQAASSSTSKP